MRNAFLLQIQDASSELVQSDALSSPDMVIEALQAFDWAGERAKEATLGKSYCAPQMSLIDEVSGDVLHIIPEAGNRYEIWLHTDRPRKKLFGLIPRPPGSVLLTLSGAPNEKAQSAIEHFLKINPDWFDQNFKQ